MLRLRRASPKQRFAESFPVTPQEPVEPSDPKAEPTRAEIEVTPEGPAEQLRRTRRYFRLTHRRPANRYASGLDSRLEDFA